jgi:predicted nucleotide-binding protein (sugar kinase/HSP70/actin superfamily)
VKALAGSVVGDAVMRMLQTAATDYKVKQSIEDVVREHMTRHAKEIISANQEFQAMLKAKVEQLITEQLLDELVSRIKVDRY